MAKNIATLDRKKWYKLCNKMGKKYNIDVHAIERVDSVSFDEVVSYSPTYRHYVGISPARDTKGDTVIVVVKRSHLKRIVKAFVSEHKKELVSKFSVLEKAIELTSDKNVKAYYETDIIEITYDVMEQVMKRLGVPYMPNYFVHFADEVLSVISKKLGKKIAKAKSKLSVDEVEKQYLGMIELFRKEEFNPDLGVVA